MRRSIDESRNFSINSAVKQGIISNGLKYSLATGNWGDQAKAHQSRAGVSQVLNRLTYTSMLSHLRRLKSPIGTDGKLAKPRQLHNTHWGMVCPAETPEGAAVGIVKNLSMMSYVTVGSKSQPIWQTIEDFNTSTLEDINALSLGDATKVFINGNWVGVHSDPHELANTLRKLRRNKYLNPEISIMHMIRERELRICSDAGRICRPLFVVNPDQTLVVNASHIQRLLEAREMVCIYMYTSKILQ